MAVSFGEPLMGDSNDAVGILEKIAREGQWSSTECPWETIKRAVRQVLGKNAIEIEDGDEAAMDLLLEMPSIDNEDMEHHNSVGNLIDHCPMPSRYQKLSGDDKILFYKAILERLAFFAVSETYDDAPPFTIQRLCELILSSPEWSEGDKDETMAGLRRFPCQYKSYAKWLRAILKTLLVTSSYNEYPHGVIGTTEPNGEQRDWMSMTQDSTRPKTPLFSPIPFLQDEREGDLISEIDLDVQDTGMIIQSGSPQNKRVAYSAEDAHTNGSSPHGVSSSEERSNGIHQTSLPNGQITRTPTGGQVDELDLALPVRTSEGTTDQLEALSIVGAGGSVQAPLEAVQEPSASSHDSTTDVTEDLAQALRADMVNPAESAVSTSRDQVLEIDPSMGMTPSIPSVNNPSESEEQLPTRDQNDTEDT